MIQDTDVDDKFDIPHTHPQTFTTMRSSSEGSSIKEIWRLLEHTEDVSSIPERMIEEEDPGGDFALVGKRIEPDPRTKAGGTVVKSQPVKAKKAKKKPVPK